MWWSDRKSIRTSDLWWLIVLATTLLSSACSSLPANADGAAPSRQPPEAASDAMCVGEREVPLVDGVTGRLVDHAQFPSVHVAARNIQVWLPPGYASGAARYPVLYMHDGQNLFDPARSYTGVDWGVDETMTRLIADGAVREAIVVGVWNTPKRFEEYMPRKAVGEDRRESGIEGMAAIAEGELLSDAYLSFLVEELKPFVDRRCRTLAGPQDTMIMGSSMGGLISLYALAEYPRVFGAAAGVSTHWPAGDGAVIDYLAASLPAPGLHRVYFDFGTRGVDARYAPFQSRMDEVMRASGYLPGRQWTTHRFEGAEHSESAWRRRLHVPLLFLLATGMPSSTNAEATKALQSPPCRP